MVRFIARGGRRRRGTFRRGRRYGGKGYRSNRISMVVPRPRAEIKQLSTQVGTYFPSANGTMTPVTYPIRGTSSSTREGSMIKTIDHQFTFTFGWSGGATNVNSGFNFRVILLDWLQASTTPAVGTIIDSASGTIASPYNQLNARMFRILRDFKVHMTAVPVGNAATFLYNEKLVTIKVPRRELVTFNGTGATDGDRQLYLLICTDPGGNSNGTISFNETMRFIDM